MEYEYLKKTNLLVSKSTMVVSFTLVNIAQEFLIWVGEKEGKKNYLNRKIYMINKNLSLIQ